MTADAARLADGVLAGDRRAIARAITTAEARSSGSRELMARLYRHTGKAHIVGITGPPGVGKSTLTDAVIEAYRTAGKTVGVVAVDPSSPFSGGAILGDRVRMTRRSTDRDVFVRSMATRGHLGGLSLAASDAVRILDASGKDVVIIETVGVGQAEVDVVRIADTVLVIAVPGLGDDIQLVKAGLMEIGDIFVLNKADREGADRAHAELAAWLESEHDETGWAPPLVRTVAAKAEGVDALLAAAARHRAHVAKHGLAARRQAQAEHEILDVLRDRVTRWALTEPQRTRYDALVAQVAARETDPYAAVAELLPDAHLEGDVPE